MGQAMSQLTGPSWQKPERPLGLGQAWPVALKRREQELRVLPVLLEPTEPEQEPLVSLERQEPELAV